MVYFFKLTDSENRVDGYIEGRPIEPITLFEESAEIWKDYEENEESDWWPVTRYGNPAEIPNFSSMEEAETEYMAAEGFEVYCRMNDC